MDRSSRQKMNKIAALNDTLDQVDLTDIHRAFHPKAGEHIFILSAHGMFPRLDHILGHKMSLNKFKKITNISSIFCGHDVMKLEINNRKTVTCTKT